MCAHVCFSITLSFHHNTTIVNNASILEIAGLKSLHGHVQLLDIKLRQNVKLMCNKIPLEMY